MLAINHLLVAQVSGQEFDKPSSVDYGKCMGSIQKVEMHLQRRNVRGLCAALRDRNALLRRRAAQALGELGDPSGVHCLEHALCTDKDQYVQQWAIDSLRAIGSPAALDVLTSVYFGADRRLSTIAGQALATMASAHAQTVLNTRDALLRNDWEMLKGLGEHVPRILSILLNSQLFLGWPSAKRRDVLNQAVNLGADTPRKQRRELAGIGMFMSGLHTVGDVLSGLQSHSPTVRIAAADRLAATGVRWTSRPLWQRFQREIGPAGDRGSAVAIARAMAELGDERAIQHLMSRLMHTDSRIASDSARMLVEIGRQSVLEHLFWFIAAQPPTAANRNIPQVLAALQAGGGSVVEELRHLIDHYEPRPRRLMVELIARCGHPEAVSMLSQLARDMDLEVQRAALDALAELNTPAAADSLVALVDDKAPQNWIVRALTAMTSPRAIDLLRQVDPSSTTLLGTLLENRAPLAQARVQVIQYHQFAGQNQWGWRAISGRAETDQNGSFALSLFSFEADWTLRLKVVTPVLPDGQGGQAFTADIRLTKGQAHEVRANIDRLFDHLVVEIQTGGKSPLEDIVS